MEEKVFKVVSNSKELLTADTIAMALLKSVTLSSKDRGTVFGVMEIHPGSEEKQQRCIASGEDDI